MHFTCDEENTICCYLFLKSGDRKAKNTVEAVNPSYCSKLLNEELQSMAGIAFAFNLKAEKEEEFRLLIKADALNSSAGGILG